MDEYERLFEITRDMVQDDIKHFVQDHMVDYGWAEEVNGTYVLTDAGRAQLEDHVNPPQ